MLQVLGEHRRRFNLLAFAGCAVLLALAYYLQYVEGMEPCPLCIFQRLAVAGVGFGFLLAALHNPAGWGTRVYAGLVLGVSVVGAVLAGRHLWLQSLPPDQVPACGPGLGLMLEMFPLVEVIQVVLAGSGECAEVETLLGVTLPAWTLVGFVLLGAFGLLVNWPRRR